MDNFKIDQNKEQSIDTLLAALHDKADSLVWLARKPNPEDSEGMADYYSEGCNLATRFKMAQITADYPEEAEMLKCPEEGDWAHGFNSGMLATVRFLMTALDKEPDYIDEEDKKDWIGSLKQALFDFPDLDT